MTVGLRKVRGTPRHSLLFRVRNRFGLTWAELAVLELVECRPFRIVELAEATGVGLADLSEKTADLVAVGYVVWSGEPGNRVLRMTPAGRMVALDLLPAVEAFLAELAGASSAP
ncbi:MarR family winged helix-turn-helix transcriptional regulator [Actinoalloteichus caeruleus]|uniref:MarR family winged helix-turn-helix transcriptional regulator n=1 Tax=Actinoalloteichus cyanogriseus TaxID=2893586 RepID=UPI00055869DE|nr:MarR family winged helix-turn-helix transcriptional regulator [Actinoalloteichus caeruleus]